MRSHPDLSENLVRRNYPPFGLVPALVPGDHQLQVRTDQTVVLLAGFFAAPQGVLVSYFRSATRAGELQGAEFAFEVLNGQPSVGSLEVWAEFTEVGAAEATRVDANLRQGGGGQDDGLDAQTFELWFPIDIASLESDVSFWLRWEAAGIPAGSLTIERGRLERASRSAITM